MSFIVFAEIDTGTILQWPPQGDSGGDLEIYRAWAANQYGLPLEKCSGRAN